MNVKNVLKVMGMVLMVVVVSIATNKAMEMWKVQNDSENFTTENIPAGYAAFKSAGDAMKTDFTVAAELTVNAVVHVKVKSEVKEMIYNDDPIFQYFFGQPQMKRKSPVREGSGSGVIISQDGYIVTNNHVVDGSKEIEVVLNDKRSYRAEVVGADPNTDIALLKIEAKDLPVIIFGNSDDLKVGEWVLAVGNPFNLTSTVTAGIVSAKGRDINIINAEMKIESFIQTDAAVNPGNSGGALVNTRGELVGINTAIASETGSYSGYSFAVPSSIVQKIVADIRKFGTVQRAVLGVQIGNINEKLKDEKSLNTLEGAYVGGVVEKSAAENAGIKEGDVIVKVNESDVKSASQLQEQIGRYNPGDKVKITVFRGKEQKTFEVTLKNRQGTTEIVKTGSIDVLGAAFKPIGKDLKEKLGVDYGVEVQAVLKGKFKENGIREGYVILKINNQTVNSEEDIKNTLSKAVNNNDQNKVLFIVGVYPNGKVAYYAIDMNN